MEAEFLRKYVARDQKSFTIIIYEVNLLRAYFFHTSTKAVKIYILLIFILQKLNVGAYKKNRQLRAKPAV